MQYGPPFFLKVGVHFAPPNFNVKNDKIPLSPLFSLAIYFLLQFTLNMTLVLFPALKGLSHEIDFKNFDQNL